MKDEWCFGALKKKICFGYNLPFTFICLPISLNPKPSNLFHFVTASWVLYLAACSKTSKLQLHKMAEASTMVRAILLILFYSEQNVSSQSITIPWVIHCVHCRGALRLNVFHNHNIVCEERFCNQRSMLKTTSHHLFLTKETLASQMIHILRSSRGYKMKYWDIGSTRRVGCLGWGSLDQ